MSKDSEKKYEYGKPSTRYYDALTWRIPSVSSIPHRVDYVVQSPPFTFDGAAFILKMYPYGETECGSEGYINVILERLHSQTDDQNICVQMFCTGVVDKKVKNVGIDYRFTKYNTLLKTRKFMQNLKDSPEKERIAPNDIFTLVCAFRKSLKEQDCQTKSICVNVGKYEVFEVPITRDNLKRKKFSQHSDEVSPPHTAPTRGAKRVTCRKNYLLRTEIVNSC